MLKHAKRTYSTFQPAKFEEDVRFLGELAASLERVVLEDKDFEEIKEERLLKLDSAPCIPEHHEGETEEEPDDLVRFVSELTLALRTLEVLGQIVKNFPGSLIGADKFSLVKEAYDLGLRTVSMILDLFNSNSQDFVEMVVERVLTEHPELNDQSKRLDFEKNLKAFMFWMIEISCFGLLKRISNAVGHSQLTETYSEVLAATNTNAVALVDISVQLDNLGLPEDRLEGLAKRFKDSVFSERLLRQMVVQHFYLFPTRESTKQKVCELLDIPIRNLRGLDIKAKAQKLAPPKI